MKHALTPGRTLTAKEAIAHLMASDIVFVANSELYLQRVREDILTALDIRRGELTGSTKFPDHYLLDRLEDITLFERQIQCTVKLDATAEKPAEVQGKDLMIPNKLNTDDDLHVPLAEILHYNVSTGVLKTENQTVNLLSRATIPCIDSLLRILIGDVLCTASDEPYGAVVLTSGGQRVIVNCSEASVGADIDSVDSINSELRTYHDLHVTVGGLESCLAALKNNMNRTKRREALRAREDLVYALKETARDTLTKLNRDTVDDPYSESELETIMSIPNKPKRALSPYQKMTQAQGVYSGYDTSGTSNMNTGNITWASTASTTF